MAKRYITLYSFLRQLRKYNFKYIKVKIRIKDDLLKKN